MFGFMNFQVFELFGKLNTLAGLPNEPRNVPCATGHLQGPLGPTSAQRRPIFLYRRIFGLSELRRHVGITPKFESPMQMADNMPGACPEHVGTSGTY